ncbi:hypothetical protein A3224_00390 [Microbulbifer thermotolerans]|uniref:Uncharacterized protein n=1 Tax=Microbulbifer thermotolerans TaxID=252514 RepID=A0A143HHP4_MICTH|nr:hypothetical protein A3224_00390 [Microbulbifer thermotolerans]
MKNDWRILLICDHAYPDCALINALVGSKATLYDIAAPQKKAFIAGKIQLIFIFPEKNTS